MRKTFRLFIPALLAFFVSACNLSLSGSSIATEPAESISTPKQASEEASAASLPAGMPTFETDFGNFIGALQSGKFLYLNNLAVEKYDASAYATPGTLTFNATFPATETVYLYYGWCAKDAATLQQNLEHLQLVFYFNDQQIPSEYVTAVNTQTSDGLQCTNAGMLLSGWTPGIQRFRVVANFDEAINDGLSEYGAGDYIAEYTVSVQ